jgi:hypothetical protein
MSMKKELEVAVLFGKSLRKALILTSISVYVYETWVLLITSAGELVFYNSTVALPVLLKITKLYVLGPQ